MTHVPHEVAAGDLEEHVGAGQQRLAVLVLHLLQSHQVTVEVQNATLMAATEERALLVLFKYL